MIDDRRYLLYAHINKSNDKMYIGITSHQKNPNLRWANGYGYIESTRFYNAIKKYGWNNFWHIILKRDMTIEEAEKEECRLIKMFQLQNPDYGYNISEGGGKPPYIGHPLTEFAKEKIGAASRERWANMPPEEKKQKMDIIHNSPKLLKYRQKCKKQVVCIKTNETFDGLIDAGRFIRPDAPELGAKNISQHCNHPEVHKSAYGKHWRFLE